MRVFVTGGSGFLALMGQEMTVADSRIRNELGFTTPTPVTTLLAQLRQ